MTEGGICPHCKDRITSVLNVQEVQKTWDLRLDAKGNPHYDEIDGFSDEFGDILCSSCEEQIHDLKWEEDVVAFLKGELEAKK